MSLIFLSNTNKFKLLRFNFELFLFAQSSRLHGRFEYHGAYLLQAIGLIEHRLARFFRPHYQIPFLVYPVYILNTIKYLLFRLIHIFVDLITDLILI